MEFDADFFSLGKKEDGIINVLISIFITYLIIFMRPPPLEIHAMGYKAAVRHINKNVVCQFTFKLVAVNYSEDQKLFILDLLVHLRTTIMYTKMSCSLHSAHLYNQREICL